MARFDSFELISTAVQMTGRRILAADESSLRRQVRELRTLSDAQLSDRCQAMLKVGWIPTPRVGLAYLWQVLRNAVSGSSLDPSSVRHVAHGIEAFRRAPADLGVGAELYREQEQAAMALLQNTVIQMETGEGKTYALLPAAFALAVQHGTVYILCANEFLARRDAARTGRFWHFVGVIPGVGVNNCDEREWSRRVVYTTIAQLLFKYMKDQVRTTPAAYPLVLGGVLMDDADVVLLDDAGDYNLINRVAGEAFPWGDALEFCDQLVPAGDETTDPAIKVYDDASMPYARLTVKGEEMLREHLGSQGAEAAAYLLARQAVELAYLAKHVLVEGNHYVVEDGAIHAVSQVDGRVRPDWSPSWVAAVEFLRGLPTTPEEIVTYSTRPSVLLKQFSVCSGVSGTVTSDAIEFLIGYLLRPVQIAPRFRRHAGQLPDANFYRKVGALGHSAELVEEAVGQGRPVLVGTHTISEAEACYDLLRQRLQGRARVTIMTGQNVDREMHLFETAGSVGSVMVATQVAGRGVDIRLSEDARENGGLYLIGLGHSRQSRHDRQFLGRAGRHGDPFTAVFVCSLDDEFYNGYRLGLMKKVANALDFPPDAPMEASTIVRRLSTQIQQDHRWWQLRQRRSELALDRVDTSIGESRTTWQHMRQIVETDEDGDPEYAQVAAQFITFAIDRYLETNLHSMIDGSGRVTPEQAAQLADAVAEIVGYNPHVATRQRLTANLIGRTGAEAREVVINALTTGIAAATRVNARRRRRLYERASEEQEAAEQVADLREQVRMLDDVSSGIAGRLAELAAENAALALEPAVAPAGDGLEPAVVPAPAGEALEPVADGHAPVTTDPELAGLPGVGVAARLRAQASISLFDLRAAADEALMESDLNEIEEIVHAARVEVTKRLNSAESRAGRGDRAAFNRISNRTPRQIADWTMTIAQAQFHKERSILSESLRRSNTPGLQQLRSLNDQLMHLWARTEAEMAKDMLRGLARCWYLPSLDPVFTMADHLAPTPGSTPRSAENWTVSAATDVSESSQQRGDSLIAAFLGEVDQELDSDEKKARVAMLLRDFLAGAPLAMLQAPEQIALRLLEWRNVQDQRQRPPSVVRADQWWLSRFLRFLRDRGAIAELPSAAANLRASIGRLVRNLGEKRTLIPTASAVLFAAVLALVARIHVGPAASFTPLLSLGDALFSGGLLESRSILGPIIVGAVVPITIMGSVPYLFNSASKSGRLNLALIPLITCALWAVRPPWGDPLSLRMLFAIAVAIGIVWLFVTASSIEYQLELWANLQLLPAWLCAVVLLAYLPRIGAMGPADARYVVGAFAGATLVGVALYPVNRAKLLVQFRHVGSVRAIGDAELAVTEYRIEGTSGARPHGYAILLALLSQPLLQVGVQLTAHRPVSADVGAVVAVAVYLTVILIVTFRTIKRRCSVPAWSVKINANSQVLHSGLKDRNLAGVLAAARWRLTAIEVLAQTALVLVACWLTWGYRVPGTFLPIALPLILGAAVAAEQGRVLLNQLRGVLLLRANPTAAAVDLPPVRADKDDDEPVPVWRALGKRVLLIVSTAIGILVVLASILDTTTFWDTVRGWFLR